MSSTKRFSYVSMLVALAILLNLAESMFIPPIQFGIRFGIANIVSLITIERFGLKDMIVVNIMRVLIANLMRGTIFSSIFWISGGGVLLSSLFLIILTKSNSSLIFKSIISSIAHSTGQVLVVMIIYSQVSMISFIPILLITSIPTGYLTGIIAKEVLKRVKIGGNI